MTSALYQSPAGKIWHPSYVAAPLCELPVGAAVGAAVGWAVAGDVGFVDGEPDGRAVGSSLRVGTGDAPLGGALPPPVGVGVPPATVDEGTGPGVPGRLPGCVGVEPGEGAPDDVAPGAGVDAVTDEPTGGVDAAGLDPPPEHPMPNISGNMNVKRKLFTELPSLGQTPSADRKCARLVRCRE